MTVPGWLERVSINWTDFDEASRLSSELVQDLAADRALLRRMVLRARRDERLRSLAEQHDVLAYLVLYDALDRGLRIRLHRFPKGLVDTPHNHRFSFSSTLIHGSYLHTVFRLERADAMATGRRWTLDQPEDWYTGPDLREISIRGLHSAFQTTQAQGSCYTLHHSTIHATAMPIDEAYSVFCRGPAEKPCALQLQPALQAYRWKFGRDNESKVVLADRRMPETQLDRFIDDLEEKGII